MDLITGPIGSVVGFARHSGTVGPAARPALKTVENPLGANANANARAGLSVGSSNDLVMVKLGTALSQSQPRWQVWW